jgi:hypothetical protein
VPPAAILQRKRHRCAGLREQNTWSEINPHVEPVSFFAEKAGRVLVDVHQVVRDLAGNILAGEHVGHRFTIEHDLIQSMEVCSLSP